MSRLRGLEARPRVRAGGRSERVRQRVARACLDLLAAGDAGFGPVDVARRSGVSRATLHRWWPTKADLLREALTMHTRSLVVADTGSWPDDLRALAHQFAAFFADPVEVSLNALMASGAHPEFTDAVLDHYGPLFDDWRALVRRAQARGEAAADADPDAVLLALASPLLLVPLLYRGPLTAGDVDRIAALVLRGTETGAGAAAGPQPGSVQPSGGPMADASGPSAST
jgi:AcrR family transcriptional regulator